MTPEERLTSIENLLKTVTEHHAKHEEWLIKHEEWLIKHDEQLTRHVEQMSELRELQKAMAAGMIELQESQRASSRKFAEDLRALDQKIYATAEAQRITEEKLHILIDTVDRVIRSQGGRT